jgi:hypothetical protein
MENDTWEKELRTLARQAFVLTITSKNEHQLMWARRPRAFIDNRTTCFLDDFWIHFPAWRLAFERSYPHSPLADTWDTLSIDTKRQIANKFINYSTQTAIV